MDRERSMYEARRAMFSPRAPREFNPLVLENVEWMKDWWARRDALQARTQELMDSGRFDWASEMFKANPVVRISAETVRQPVPPIVEVPDPITTASVEF